MDIYNIIIIGLINVLIFVIIETIVVYLILLSALNKIINGVLESTAGTINDTINNNYDNVINNVSVNNFANTNFQNESTSFISQAFRLYLIGYFSDEIINEYKISLTNMIKSSICFFTIICGILLALLATNLVNYFIFDNKYKLNYRLLGMNLAIGFLLLIIFIIAAGFGVFAKMNPDTTDIQIKILYYLKNKLQ